MSKKTLRAIQERNRRVEMDKAWETSVTRRTIIATITYAVVVIFLYIINAPMPFLSALVPCAGYLLSTLTMPMFKRAWIRRMKKNV